MHYRRGITLVELMVGITIGMLASLAIVQLFASYEGQRRSTTVGSEAQENGLMALVQMEQDIQNAGAGLTDPNTLACNKFFTYLDGGSGSGGAAIPNFSLNAVSIADGASNGNDEITIRSGGKFLGSLPVMLSLTMASNATEFYVSNPNVFNVGDLSIVAQNGNCTILNVTHVHTTGNPKIEADPVNGAPNNPPASFKTANAWPSYTAGAVAKSIGSVTARTYSLAAVNGVNSLRMVTADVATNSVKGSEILAKDIVSLQAQYGVAPANSQVVNAWVNAAGSTWGNPNAANARRIKAIRLVLIARSGKKEASNVTGTCVNNAGTNNGPCAWQDTAANPAPLIDLSSDPDWRRYRYSVYQTVIPLRNIIWANV